MAIEYAMIRSPVEYYCCISFIFLVMFVFISEYTKILADKRTGG